MEEILDYIGFIVALIVFVYISLKRFLAFTKPEEAPKKTARAEMLDAFEEEETLEIEVTPPLPPPTPPALLIQKYEEKKRVEAHRQKTAILPPEVEILEEEKISMHSLLEEQRHPVALILFHDLLNKPKSW